MASKNGVIMQKRPALISVTQARPPSSPLRSMLKTPPARVSSARIASAHVRTTAGSATMCARPGVEEMPLGWLPPPKYDSRSQTLISTISPSRHRAWAAKSRPGRYSESVKASTATPRISCQYSIHARAWAGRTTGMAPREPLPLRMRHHSRGRPKSAKIASIAGRSVTTAVRGAGTPRARSAVLSRYLSWHVAMTSSAGRNSRSPRAARAAASTRTSSSLPGRTRSMLSLATTARSACRKPPSLAGGTR